MSRIDINVHYVTRVEGHGNIVVKIEDNQVKEFRWEIPEAPRFFEAMVRGRHFTDVPFIVSRICGICGIGHTFAAIQALENAIGFKPSEQTMLLRKLLLHGETIQSHTLHFGYLALPDFLGVPSVVPLAQTHRDELLTIIRLHRLANEMCDLIGADDVRAQRVETDDNQVHLCFSKALNRFDSITCSEGRLGSKTPSHRGRSLRQMLFK